jgi:hypothetical protein
MFHRYTMSQSRRPRLESSSPWKLQISRLCIRYILRCFHNIHFQTITIGILGLDSWRGLGIFLFTTVFWTALGPTQPPIQWVPGTLFLGVKRPGRAADHSPPSTAEIKNAWSYTSSPPYVFMAWCLVKHRDSFTLLFTVVYVAYFRHN